jgi:hypothetical protein
MATQTHNGVLQDATTGAAIVVNPDGTAITGSAGASADVAGTLTAGRKTVAAAGTAEVIRATLACKWVVVTALDSNTTPVNVGPTGFCRRLAPRRGLRCRPGQR